MKVKLLLHSCTRSKCLCICDVFRKSRHRDDDDDDDYDRLLHIAVADFISHY